MKALILLLFSPLNTKLVCNEEEMGEVICLGLAREPREVRGKLKIGKSPIRVKTELKPKLKTTNNKSRALHINVPERRADHISPIQLGRVNLLDKFEEGKEGLNHQASEKGQRYVYVS